MAIDSEPAKLDVEQYLSEAIAATPAPLHPFFESFRALHHRKSALPLRIQKERELTGRTGCGTN